MDKYRAVHTFPAAPPYIHFLFTAAFAAPVAPVACGIFRIMLIATFSRYGNYRYPLHHLLFPPQTATTVPIGMIFAFYFFGFLEVLKSPMFLWENFSFSIVFSFLDMPSWHEKHFWHTEFGRS